MEFIRFEMSKDYGCKSISFKLIDYNDNFRNLLSIKDQYGFLINFKDKKVKISSYWPDAIITIDVIKFQFATGNNMGIDNTFSKNNHLFRIPLNPLNKGKTVILDLSFIRSDNNLKDYEIVDKVYSNIKNGLYLISKIIKK